MAHVLLEIGVAIAAFLSTSVDNLFLLVAFMGGAGTRTRDVALGYAGAVAVVVALALAASWAADLVPAGWIRHLGWIPLGIGAWRLLARLRPPGAAPDAAPASRPVGPLPVFGVMLANSGDSLGVFASLLAETRAPLVVFAAATPLAMSGLWILLARGVARQPRIAPALRAIERTAVPLLLVAIGLYILVDTPTDIE